MLDPRMDFNASEVIDEFRCPKCGRVFGDWMSCQSHVVGRKHANFCDYDRGNLPTCLNAHSMLPAHSFSGYCDIQGKRKVIEDFHAIHLLPSQQFYGTVDSYIQRDLHLIDFDLTSFARGFYLQAFLMVIQETSPQSMWHLSSTVQF
jgi:hypothetical protein